MSYPLAELDRRLAALIQPGSIAAVDHANARARVKVGEWVSAWLPWASLGAGQVRNWRPPSEGEQCLLISPSGLPEGGFVLPGFYTNGHAAPDNKPNTVVTEMPDDMRQSYDWNGHRALLHLPDEGHLRVECASASIELDQSKILLKVGASTIEITDGGIRFNAPRIDLN